jgi:UDP-N-acetyl-D-glucosamine dehydrogenase
LQAYVVERASKILNRFKKPLSGSKILVLGVAYKQDVDDYRESPALKVIKNFEREGSIVEYYDPYIKEYKYGGQIKKGKAELTGELLNWADLVVITTNHSNVDYEFVQKNSIFIFDTKNVTKDVGDRDNIELL